MVKSGIRACLPGGVSKRTVSFFCRSWVNEGGKLAGNALSDEKSIWYIVLKSSTATSLGKLAPHDLWRTRVKLLPQGGRRPEQIQMLLGHSSIQTTERYLGTEQNLTTAVNDDLGLDLM